MSRENNLLLKGIPEIKDAFIIIVKTEWNSHIVNKLEEGCVNMLEEQKVKFKVITVPGAVEIPFVIKAYATSKQLKADAFIALGAVIRGDTPHFDYICKFVEEGILALNLTLNEPVIFGILTLNNEQQALERAGGKLGNKGEEFAVTAIKMIALHKSFKK